MNILFIFNLKRLEHTERKIKKVNETFDMLYDIKYPLNGKYVKKLENQSERLMLKKLALTAKLRAAFGEKTYTRPVRKIIYR